MTSQTGSREERTMKYLMMLTGDGDVPAWTSLSDEEQQVLMARFDEFGSACAAAQGVEILSAEALQEGASATTIRRSGGKRTVTEGAYADAYEGLGGFYLFEAPNLDILLELSDILPPYDMEFRPVDDTV